MPTSPAVFWGKVLAGLGWGTWVLHMLVWNQVLVMSRAIFPRHYRLLQSLIPSELVFVRGRGAGVVHGTFVYLSAQKVLTVYLLGAKQLAVCLGLHSG